MATPQKRIYSPIFKIFRFYKVPGAKVLDFLVFVLYTNA